MKYIKQKGSEAIIIGCTELSVVIENQELDIPILDSTEILANATVEYAYL